MRNEGEGGCREEWSLTFGGHPKSLSPIFGSSDYLSKTRKGETTANCVFWHRLRQPFPVPRLLFHLVAVRKKTDRSQSD